MDLPRNIRWFERIAYGDLLLSLAAEPFNERFRVSRAGYDFRYVSYVYLTIFIALFVWMIWAIARRRKNWLRWTWAIFLIFGVFSVPGYVRSFSTYPVYAAIGFLWLATQLGGTALLFTGDAVPWFRKGSVVDPATFD